MKRVFKFKISLLATIFAVAMVAACVGINVAKADAAANGVPIISDTVTKGVPGKMTVENEIKTALMPVGHALYIYGGGWNENEDPSREGEPADTGANPETETIGVPQIWADFYSKQDSSYDCDIEELDYYKHPECVHWGVDCSGYLGWVLQNITNLPNGFDTNGLNHEGWVTYAQWIGFGLGHLGYGERIVNPSPDIEDNNTDPYATQTENSAISNGTYDYIPGNIYTFGKSGEYHCWLCLGKCDDGSVLLLHCSPPGAFICGTSPEPGVVTTKAVQIASEYMKRYYTDFYNKFGVIAKPGKIEGGVYSGYLKYSEFNWNTSGKLALTDDAGLRTMTPQNIMDYIYCEDEATATLNFTGQAPVVHFNDALVELNANSTIVYNRASEADTNVNVSLAIPAGYKFDSVKINDVDYSAGLIANSNIANVNVPISGDYKIECASSEVGASPATEIAKTGDVNYAVIAVCIMLIIASGILITKKEF